jgi:dihydropyrimidinase
MIGSRERAAACGGTTTVIDFVEPDPDEKLIQALDGRRQLAERKAVIDFGLHITIPHDDAQTIQDVSTLGKNGCPSFKTYLTYEGFLSVIPS